jgi:hypothetical protein
MKIKIITIQLILLSCICLYSYIISLDSYSGTLNGGESDTLNINFDTSQLDFGVYDYYLNVIKNNSTTISIPIRLRIIPLFLAAPLNVEIIISAGIVYLSWETVPGSEGYKIYRADNPDSEFVLIGDSPDNSFIDTAGSEKDFYRITAYYTETEVRKGFNE